MGGQAAARIGGVMPAGYHRVYAFVDGGHLRAGLDAIGVDWSGININIVCHVALNWIYAQWEDSPLRISRVFLYDAVPARPNDRIEGWLERNDQEADTHVRRGKVVGVGGKQRQKAVDISLSVDALSYAARELYDVALIFAGDGDYVPVVEAIRDLGPLVGVCSFRAKLSDDLKRVADRVGYPPEDPAAWAAWQLAN